MSDQYDNLLSENLRRWRDSGQPSHWVEAHQGHWNHDDWSGLIAQLQHSEYWPLDPSAVGLVLEEWQHTRNLHRWKESGWPHHWVAEHAGAWNHDDWRALLEALQQSEYWPLDPDAVGTVLERINSEWRNLQRWRDSGQPHRWIDAHNGDWNHDDWLALVEQLQQSDYWPLNLAAVGEVLEGLKRDYANLRRWKDAGHAERWIDSHQGQWNHDDWLALLGALQHSEYWPLDPRLLGEMLEKRRRERDALQRWCASGAPLQWVEAHQGQWNHDDWLALLAELRQSEYADLDPNAVGAVLAETKLAWWNLRRWRASGLARHWVEAHQGQWNHTDWLALLEDLQRRGFWPIDPLAVSQMLEEARTEWQNLRRFQQSGHLARWLEARQGRWNRHDLRLLLEYLRHTDFWPLDSLALQQALELHQPYTRQAA